MAKKQSFLSRIWGYMGKFRGALILSLLTSTVFVGAELTLPIIFGKATDCIVGEGNVQFDKLIILFIIGIGLALLAFFAQWITDIICNKIANAITCKVRNDAFKRLQKTPLKYLDSRPVGEILSVEIGDADRLSDGLLLGFSRFFTGIITIVGTLCCMFFINPIIALIVGLITPVSLFTAKFITGRTYKYFKKQSEISGRQTALIEETLGNLQTVKVYRAEGKFIKKFDEINAEYKKASFSAVFFSSLTNPTTRFVNSVVYASVCLSGALISLSEGSLFAITAGSLLTLLSYANRYTKPFNEITSVLTELSSAKASAVRLFAIIDEEIETDKDTAVKISASKGEVEAREVNFSYSPDKKLIQGFNLKVKSGQKVAIVGPTGCGKTTLINLLMRFYDVIDGSISIDGRDIRDITRDSLRSNYGMVLQDTWIRKATVKQNIAIGKKDATDDEIISAAKRANCHGFISRLPSGYDTVIGEEGLSQGQKQLICIARVFLTLPPMLILDEATSSIDTRTELKIQAAFDSLTEGKTSFIVAHRLSTIRSADLILVMKDGNIIEQGSHAELIQKRGFYYDLYSSQFEK